MGKKLKALAGEDTAAASATDNQLIATVKDSAQQIWLAGLGAFAKAQEEGSKVFDALVKEGEAMHKKTRKLAQEKLGAKVADLSGQLRDQLSNQLGERVTAPVQAFAAKAQSQATAGWDKLEQVFEDRVARALNGLGVPTAKDIQALSKRVEELSAAVSTLGGAPKAARTRTAAAAAAQAVTKKASTKAATGAATVAATKAPAKKPAKKVS